MKTNPIRALAQGLLYHVTLINCDDYSDIENSLHKFLSDQLLSYEEAKANIAKCFLDSAKTIPPLNMLLVNFFSLTLNGGLETEYNDLMEIILGKSVNDTISYEEVCEALSKTLPYLGVFDIICAKHIKDGSLREVFTTACSNNYSEVVELMLEIPEYLQHISISDTVKAKEPNINRMQSPEPSSTQETESNANQSPVFSAKAGATKAARESIAETTLSQDRPTLTLR
jgi:hypothetical protein